MYHNIFSKSDKIFNKENKRGSANLHNFIYEERQDVSIKVD